jgi:hypothetical protein
MRMSEADSMVNGIADYVCMMMQQRTAWFGAAVSMFKALLW